MITMITTDIINNAATAVIMAPISVEIAFELGYAVEPFLMVVAVGASCAFLTPIGHQCNTVVPGFEDENGRFFLRYLNKHGNDGYLLEEWKKDLESFMIKAKELNINFDLNQQ